MLLITQRTYDLPAAALAQWLILLAGSIYTIRDIEDEDRNKGIIVSIRCRGEAGMMPFALLVSSSICLEATV